MTNSIRREILIPQSPDQVWMALTNRATLAEWMYPNDFEPRIGHRFTFQVPPKPQVGFQGLTVHCEVLECDPPRQLVFSWSVKGPVENTRVSYRLAPEGNQTRLYFEHAGFDLAHQWGKPAFHGAEAGWTSMLQHLVKLIDRLNSDAQPESDRKDS